MIYDINNFVNFKFYLLSLAMTQDKKYGAPS